MKDGVDRRQAADAAAIPVSSDTVEERLGVAPFDRLQHLPILGLDPGALGLCDRARIAEAWAHVGEIGARDQCDAPAARCDGLSERGQEPGNARVGGGTAPACQRLVSEAGQHRHDRDVPASGVEVLEEHRLELDRVLVPVRQLGAEAVLRSARGQGLDEIAISAGGPERRVVVLAGERERMAHADVAGPHDDEEVGRAPLGEVAIGPGVCGPTAMEVDVGRDDRLDRRGAGLRRPRDDSGAFLVSEEGVHRRSKLISFPGIGPAGMRRRPGRRAEERAVDLRPALREARRLEKSVLVEHGDDLVDVRSRDVFALVPATEVGLDLADGVLAVEEGDHIDQRLRQEQDRFRVAGGVAQRDEALASLRHWKGFDPAELRRLHQPSRNLSAVAV